MILKYILYFLLISIVFCGWYVLVMYMREMNKRMQRVEVLAKQNKKQLNAKAGMDDTHFISLAIDITELNKRIRYAEQAIGYTYPEKEDPEC